jgi:hypothetical protein
MFVARRISLMPYLDRFDLDAARYVGKTAGFGDEVLSIVWTQGS